MSTSAAAARPPSSQGEAEHADVSMPMMNLSHFLDAKVQHVILVTLKSRKKYTLNILIKCVKLYLHFEKCDIVTKQIQIISATMTVQVYN